VWGGYVPVRRSSGVESVVALLDRFENCSLSTFFPRSFGSFVDARATPATIAAAAAAATTTKTKTTAT
jgi:hypothetical protein